MAACIGLMAGCDVGSKPEPPYKDPPPNQRIKSRVPAPQYLQARHEQARWLPSAQGGIAPYRRTTLK